MFNVRCDVRSSLARSNKFIAVVERRPGSSRGGAERDPVRHRPSVSEATTNKHLLRDHERSFYGRRFLAWWRSAPHAGQGRTQLRCMRFLTGAPQILYFVPLHDRSFTVLQYSREQLEHRPTCVYTTMSSSQETTGAASITLMVRQRPVR